MNNLTNKDWNYLHDCILNFTGKNCTKDELIDIFNELPIILKCEAFNSGMNNKIWQNHFLSWYYIKL